MGFIRRPLIAGSTLIVAAGAALAGVLATAARSPAAPARSAPPPTVRAQLITRFPRTLTPGTEASPRRLGQRVFVDARHGFALFNGPQAQYAAATADGGRTWRTDGPALHVAAAQGPLAIADLGAINRRTIYAYGGAQAVDVTTDGGRRWWRSLFDGETMAVVRDMNGHLVTFVDVPGRSGAGATRGPVVQYVTRDGGRSWHEDTTVGGS